MGDRCYLEMTIRERDLPVFERVFGPGFLDTFCDSARRDGGGVVSIEVCEANYGCYSERYEAARKRAVFFGTHTSGYDYDGAAFVGVGGKLFEVAANNRGLVVAEIDNIDSGLIGHQVQANIVEYARALRQAKHEMRIT